MIKKIIKYFFQKKGYDVIPMSYYKFIVHQSASFSQCGEDLIVNYIFNLRNIVKPSYLDIGAHDPYYLSNTAIFYKNGCRGINIDADPRLISNFELYRPGDINLNVGIGLDEGIMDFYVMKDSTLSTMSEQELNHMGHDLLHIEKVKVTTINTIIEKYCNNVFPDFLSLDAEGMDLQILKSINFNGSVPKVICVEAAEYSPIGAGKRRSELIDFLVSKGYYEYANTNLNAIMVKKDFWFI